MFLEERQGIKLHKTGRVVDGKRGCSPALDKISTVCFWLLDMANTNRYCATWVRDTFYGGNRPLDYSSFLTFLVTPYTSSNNLYGYMVVISALHDYMKRNDYNKTPATLRH